MTIVNPILFIVDKEDRKLHILKSLEFFSDPGTKGSVKNEG